MTLKILFVIKKNKKKAKKKNKSIEQRYIVDFQPLQNIRTNSNILILKLREQNFTVF